MPIKTATKASTPSTSAAANASPSSSAVSATHGTQRETACAALLIIAFLIVITLPYLVAAFDVPRNGLTPPGSVYGGLLYNADDQNVHLAWARQAREGHFFFRDLFTRESLHTPPLFTNLFCFVMGMMGRFVPLLAAYHGLRVLFAGLALWWFWKLTRHLTRDHRVRLTALALAAFGGGCGFLAPLLPGSTFIDRPDGPLMMPEAWTFASALIFPLFITSMALLIAVYEAVLSGAGGVAPAIFPPTLEGEPHEAKPQNPTTPNNPKAPTTTRATAIAFLAALLLANIHTYDVLPLGVALVVWAAYEVATSRHHQTRPNVLPVVAALIGAAIPLLYQVVVFRGSEEFRVKALTQTPAPPFINIILSYGPLLLLALYGAVIQWRQSRGVRLMTLWAAITLLLIYAPVSFARKMIEGVHLPLCLLASLGLWALLGRIKSPLLPRLIAVGFVGLLGISSLSFMLWCMGNAEENNVSRLGVYLPPLYLPPDDMAALRWLDSSPQQRDKAVLCMPWLGNYLPRETGRTVYLGHWAETLYFSGAPGHPSKLAETSRFFGLKGTVPFSAQEARDWLRANRIGLVVLGFYEKQAGATLPLPLHLAYHSGATEVYQVE